MAIIKCPECGKEISNKAAKCIYCGCPAQFFEEENNSDKIDTIENSQEMEKENEEKLLMQEEKDCVEINEKKINSSIETEESSRNSSNNNEDISDVESAENSEYAGTANLDAGDSLDEKTYKTCNRCGSRMQNDEIKCPYCGYQEKTKSKKGVLAGCAIAAIVTVIAITLTVSINYALSNVRIVKREITKIGKSDIKLGSETYDAIKQARTDYESLNDDEKKQVDNIDVLEQAEDTYQDLKYKNLNSRIGNALKVDTTEDAYDDLISLYNEYQYLNDEAKTKVPNGKKLEEQLPEIKEEYGKEKISEVLSLAQNDLSGAKEKLKNCADFLTDEQIEDCLVQMADKSVKDEAERYLKSCLKSPSSYQRQSISNFIPFKRDDGSYGEMVTITYDAANSFGAQLRGTSTITVTFTVDVDNCNFTIKDSDGFIMN